MIEIDKNRGRIYSHKLSRIFVFNGNIIEEAIIELDHINHGLNPKTKKLNTKKRLNFSLIDIEKFLFELDGEDQAAIEYSGFISKFVLRIDSPIRTKHYGKEFIMILTTHYKMTHQVYTVTLYPNW